MLFGKALTRTVASKLDRKMIDDWIAEHGVTRVPCIIVEPDVRCIVPEFRDMAVQSSSGFHVVHPNWQG